MAVASNQLYTPDEYLALERDAEFKSEYLAGQIYAMAGATEEHNLIITNVSGSFWSQLKGHPCKTYSNDMRVRVSPTGLYTYPDVTVVCGEARFLDDRKDTLLNPNVMIEVLSPSTEAYDRGEKFAHYRALESLQEYIMISQGTPRVERYVRQADGQWLLSEARGLESAMALATIRCTLPLAEVYDRISFESPASR